MEQLAHLQHESGRSLSSSSDPVVRLTRPVLRDILDRHGLSPSRALGQNFLCEPTLIDKIVRLARVAPGDAVVEIGPGLGSLTVGLAAAGASVLAIEIDRHLIPALEEVVADLDVTVVQADALTLDWPSLFDRWPRTASEPERRCRVVANLPYNIATPLVLDLLRDRPELQHWLVMVQREVGERLAAEPGDSACGIPSVLVSYWGHAEVVGRVPAEVFFPRPNVESVLVRIERTEQPRLDVPFAPFAALVRAGFGQRRKMLRRSLASMLTVQQIEAAGVRPTDRAEQLDLAAWGRLTSVHQESVR